MAEEKVLKLLRESNKPYNVQGVSDMLASQGIKKTQAEKTLMSLAQAGKIICKEFGKTKVFYASQEGLAQLDPEEKAAKLAHIKELNEKVKAQDEAIAALKKELAASNAQLNIDEMRARVEKLQTDVSNLEGKLVSMRTGATLISEEDVEKVEKEFKRMLDVWAKRKSIFRAVWDDVSENMDGKQADLFDEIGIETDEAIGEVLSNYQKLLQQSKRVKR